MKNETYKGFKIIRHSNPRHPNLIKAERYGVELCASDIVTLKAVIDEHINEREAWFEMWNNERKSS